jgi:membrane-bound inhibitor of C-type lysozyme
VRKFALAPSILLLVIQQASAQKSDDRCTFETCKAGTRAVTYYKKNDPYYACPNRELATYVNSIVALTAMQATLGVMPNVSDKTGEPEYTGQTKLLVDSLREQAHVQTFDEAMHLCAPGRNKLRVTVMNMPEHSLVAYVFDEAKKQPFWMPIAALGKVK